MHRWFKRTKRKNRAFCVSMPKKQLKFYRICCLSVCMRVCACLYGCALPIVFWTILWMIFRVRNQIKTIFSSSACSNELASAFASTQCDRIRSDQIHRFYQQFLCYTMLSVMLLKMFLFHEKINKMLLRMKDVQYEIVRMYM